MTQSSNKTPQIMWADWTKLSWHFLRICTCPPCQYEIQKVGIKSVHNECCRKLHGNNTYSDSWPVKEILVMLSLDNLCYSVNWGIIHTSKPENVLYYWSCLQNVESGQSNNPSYPPGKCMNTRKPKSIRSPKWNEETGSHLLNAEAKSKWRTIQGHKLQQAKCPSPSLYTLY